MDKIALITGSTKGIGKQIGIDLLYKGYFVYFNYTHDSSSAKILYNELINKYLLENFKIIKADLSTIKGADTLLYSVPKQLDVLIFNAGITDRTKFGEINLKKWYEVFNTNLNIPFYIVQKNKDNISENGRIIFISSVLSKIPHGTSISYAVSKAGVNALILYLAKEFANKNITVNAICPGFVGETNWHKNKSEEQIKRIEDKILLKRFATVREISSLVMEVIDNQYITGTTVDITGGYGL